MLRDRERPVWKAQHKHISVPTEWRRRRREKKPDHLWGETWGWHVCWACRDKRGERSRDSWQSFCPVIFSCVSAERCSVMFYGLLYEMGALRRVKWYGVGVWGCQWTAKQLYWFPPSFWTLLSHDGRLRAPRCDSGNRFMVSAPTNRIIAQPRLQQPSWRSAW